MRKPGLLLIVICLFFTIQSHAQLDRPQFQFGFKLAPNLGWMKPDLEDYSSEGIKAGFSWGFVGEYNLTQTYGISSGFSITSNFGKIEYPYKKDSLLGTMHRTYSLRSLEIPVLLKMRTKEIGNFIYFGTIGFGTSINLKAKAEDVFDITSPSVNQYTEELETKNKIRFLRESLIVGLGTEYNISGNTCIYAGVLFNNGFTNVLKGSNTVKTNHVEKGVTNYFELNVGVLF